jgi:ribulose-phosphate 3-epimerase
MVPKIAEARRMSSGAGVDIDIAVDGGIDVSTAPKVVRAGANLLIAGSSVFASEKPPADACKALDVAANMALISRSV